MTVRDREMTADLMRDFCREAGLTCMAQEIIPWEFSRRPIDCFTVFKKENVHTPLAAPRVFVNHRFMQEAACARRLASIYWSLK